MVLCQRIAIPDYSDYYEMPGYQHVSLH